MKKSKLLLFVITMLPISLFAQLSGVKFTASNFESRILSYQPIKKEGVTIDNFDRGIFILNAAKSDVKDDQMKFTHADYWNILTAFIYLKEPQNHLDLAFQKAIDNNPEATCELIDAFGDKAVKRLTEAVPKVFLPFYETCKNTMKVEEVFDPKSYASKNGFDLNLVKLMHQISEDDQRFRKVKGEVDWSKQTPLDENNMRLIDSLYNAKGTYIGKNLVGKKLESAMWAVIQHSNIETMEKYLPIMHDAIKKGNLSQGTLKLTIDRIYCDKYNYQPFGSQYGGDCELSSKEIREKVKAKYGFN